MPGLNEIVGAFRTRPLDHVEFTYVFRPLGDKTPSATFTITPSATCTANSCTATTVGVRTVTATIGSVSSTALLDVRKAQALKFTAPTSKVMTQSPVALGASASSGLILSFVSTTLAACTTAGPNDPSVVLAGAGTCNIKAQQSGDANCAPAPLRTFTVNKASQTITFAVVGGLIGNLVS